MTWASSYLAISVLGAWLTFNAWRPRYAPASVAIVSFFAGWLTAELALHHLAFHALLAAYAVHDGALATWQGKAGLAVSVTTWPFLWLTFRHGHGARDAVAGALARVIEHQAEGEAPSIPPPASVPPPALAMPWKDILLPFPVRHRDVERLRAIPYHREGRVALRVDVHRNRARPKGCPVLVYVHGGGWVIGQKRYQGLPLMQSLAARGWVCFAVDYRLSPRATFPDHLVDVKRALAWVREHAAEYGGDPDFILLSGNSAGAHLASLAALTANEAEYQPGFEHVDTTVAGCIALYGIYDFRDRHGHCANPGLTYLLERHVMKVGRAGAEEAYAKASPVDRIHAGAPPFFVVHGDGDTLAPVKGARQFCDEFRARALAPIAYAEIPGAQHAFEIFPSLRTAHLIAGLMQFASHLHEKHVARRASASLPPSLLPPALGDLVASALSRSAVASPDAAPRSARHAFQRTS